MSHRSSTAKLCLATAGLMLLAKTIPGEAAVFYVGPEGDDRVDGSLERPFATLQKAHAAASPGDTVLIRGGTYLIGPNRTTGVEFSKNGEPGKPLIAEPSKTGRSF